MSIEVAYTTVLMDNLLFYLRKAQLNIHFFF